MKIFVYANNIDFKALKQHLVLAFEFFFDWLLLDLAQNI